MTSTSTETERKALSVVTNECKPAAPDPPAKCIVSPTEESEVTPKAVTKQVPDLPLDIEHVPVEDDPRQWSGQKKTFVLVVICTSAFIGTMASAIYFPAVDQIEMQLDATSAQTALTASLFILFQGILPTLWASTSELIGRKKCYYASSIIFIAASLGCAFAPNIQALIGLRVVQSAGASAVISVGAGSLADLYEVSERGRKVGIFYGAPLLAQSCSPLIGGALTSASSWRASFYFCAGYGALVLLLQIPLPEPFRKERSLAWRRAAKRAEAAIHQKAATRADREQLSRTPDQHADREVTAGADDRSAESPVDGQEKAPDSPTNPDEKAIKANGDLPPVRSRAELSRVLSIRDGKLVLEDGTTATVKVTLRDVNPIAALGSVVRRPANVFLSSFTGLYFGVSYCLTYTGGFTYTEAPYNYSPLITGCILLAFGGGGVIGSIFGGRHSDRSYARQKEANGGRGEPEMRIRATWIPLICIPPLLVGYAWSVDQGADIAVCVVIFALIGLAGMWAYSALLTYVVDANPGRASSAIAFNSFCRGTAAFIASQISQPLISSMGHGAFYTGFAGVLALGELSLLVVQYKGKAWRDGSSQQGRKITDARADVPNRVAGEAQPLTSPADTAIQTPLSATWRRHLIRH